MFELERALNLLAPYVAHYGYFVAFFGMLLENAGVPLPAETSLLALTVFAHRSVLNIWIILPLAILGDIAGDQLGYWIGRLGGRKLVEKYGKFLRIKPENFKKSEEMFEKRGAWAVFFGQFFAGTRVTIALISGTLKLEYKKFVVADSTAATIYIGSTGLAAYFLAENLGLLLRVLWTFRIIGYIAAVAIIVAIIYYWDRKRRKK